MIPDFVVIAVSRDLISHVREIFSITIQEARLKGWTPDAGPLFTPRAYPAFVSAVASIEAFLNETLLGRPGRVLYPESVVWKFLDDLERLETRSKLLLVPQLLLGRSLARDRQPFQGFNLLVRMRNDIVHYKAKNAPPSYVDQLVQERVALPKPGPSQSYCWQHQICSHEAIRWAHNVACSVV